MTAKYFAILTNQGAARLANAVALGTTLNITQMAVGDANGVLPTPDPAQTALINQKRIAALNMLSIDPNNSSQIIAEQVIPENEGGYWIREIGLYDDSGVLVAVANCPETYKPLLQEGSGRTQTIRMVLIVSSTSAVTLKIDPAVVLATRQYVDNKVIEVKAYADNLLSQHIAASNPHTQYAPIASPTFTGTPKAPTAAQTANDTQLATTAFVKAAIAALVNGAPATLDTLAELATALGNNPNFSTTVTNALAGKQPLDNTLTALSGKSVAALLEYLGLGDIALAGVCTGVLDDAGHIDIPMVVNGEKKKLIIQWGSTSTTTSGSTVTLPTTFPTKYCAGVGCEAGAYSSIKVAAIIPLSLSTIGVYGRSPGTSALANTSVKWIVIGY
ncbi:phage tail protein [Kosakonia sp. YIM B13605]|uniref:phage tail protein n=1 Tax=Kosakonia TaxID=1330547 RepID=UPI0032D9915B